MKKESQEILYSTFSFYEWFKLLFIKTCLIAFIIYCGLHLLENPIVVSVVICLAIFVLIAIGNENIKVYGDRFVYSHNSLYKKLLIENVYFYKEVKQVEFYGLWDTKKNSIIPEFILAAKPFNSIYITFKSEKVVTIPTRLYKEDLLKAIELINKKCAVS